MNIQLLYKPLPKRLCFLLMLAGLFAWPYFGYAETTQGAAKRNVAIDGKIGALVAKGTNNGQWEADEHFQGFQGPLGSLDWYLTWDEDNLYLARITGNNNEPSLLFLRADYSGAVFNNNPQDYDGFHPSFSNMNGINFIAYMKNGYDEYRVATSSSAWSGAATSLNPMFGEEPNGDDVMEIAIPWNAITGGKGKPTNIRAVMYQTAPGACGGGPLPYGESPWGTGVSGSGPNIGVNDGMPTSAAQPGGCGNLNQHITRWWGCYPVIGGVSANGFEAIAPDAGDDDTICEPNYALKGNAPAADAVGTWAVLSKPAGAPDPTFDNIHDPLTTVRGLVVPAGSGNNSEYRFGWSINYGACPATPDEVKIIRWVTPSDANAGSNSELACEVSTFNLQGNLPDIGTGQWNIAQGSGIFTDKSNAIATVSSLGYGKNIIEWVISNGPCPVSKAQILLTRYATPVADAGQASVQVCAANTMTLAANNPATTIPGIASGKWTQASGPSTVVFSDDAAFNSTVTWSEIGAYRLKWTTTSGTCGSVSDEILLNIFNAPVADAGENIEACVTSGAQALAGNNPALIATTASGVWRKEILEGGASLNISDTTQYNATIAWMQPGLHRLTWIVKNGPCSEVKDQITVRIYAAPAANAGAALSSCDATGSLTLSANNPSIVQSSATGKWTSDPSNVGTITFADASKYNTSISWSDIGTYKLIWTVSNGACANASSVVLINIGENPKATAGNDIEACFSESFASIKGNDPSVFNANGLWRQLSGPSTLHFDDETQPSTKVRWTVPGAYQIEWRVFSACPQAGADQLTLTVYQVPSLANAGADFFACQPAVSLQATTPIGGTGKWTSLGTASVSDAGNPLSAVSNLKPGLNRFRWEVSNGTCPSSADTVGITLVSTPTFSTEKLDNNCAEDADGRITISVKPTDFLATYSINGGAFQAGKIFDNLTAGSYPIKAQSTVGDCEYNVGTVTIASPTPIAGFAVSTVQKSNTPTSADGSFSVTAPTGGTPPYQYSINGGIFGTQRTFDGLLPDTYVVQVKDAKGCIVEIAVEVPHKLLPEIFNAFSPNGDENNDVWNLHFLSDYPDAVVRIFNIWGEELYKTEGAYTAWDGELNSKPVPDGTYYYWIDLKNGTGILKGDLTIVR